MRKCWNTRSMLHQRPVEALDRLPVVGPRRRSWANGSGIGNFVRSAMDVHPSRRAVRPARRSGRGSRPRSSPPARKLARFARLADQGMVATVEGQGDRPSPSGTGPSSGRAAYVERGVPGVVHPGRVRQPVLADDLRPQMERRAGFRPSRHRAMRAIRSRAYSRSAPCHGRAARPQATASSRPSNSRRPSVPPCAGSIGARGGASCRARCRASLSDAGDVARRAVDVARHSGRRRGLRLRAGRASRRRRSNCRHGARPGW